MAEYLIQDTTLDAIADAINAKTGGSSAMTPAQMVTAIGTISGGGIDPTEFTQIGSFTLAEDVREFDFDITNYDYTRYIIYVNGSGTGADYLYISAAASGNGYSLYITGNTYNGHAIINLVPSGTKIGSSTTLQTNYSSGQYLFGSAVGTGQSKEEISTLTKIRLFAFRASGVLNAGMTIIVYGGY